MNPILKNVLAVIAGFIAGSIVNSLLVNIGPSLIPPPEGADLSMEGLKASMELFEPKHFIFPFLAHALGTLVGAFVAFKLGATHKKRLALIVGVLFLLGGITAVAMFGGPLWFKALDLVVAYIPMAIVGAKLAGA